MTPATTLCPCSSAKPFADCCEPYLLLKQKPKSPRALVRARYSAYALGAGTYREFLMRTWHPATANKVNPTDLTNDNLTWTGLEILFADQKADKGRVEFKASYIDNKGQPHIHHERALFHRIQSTWLYLDGQVRDLVEQAAG
jgi:SEC-C motif-containing protein